EAAMPKSVRGTFMQGAPIAEDVARGRDADWPFPLMPDFSAGSSDVSDSESYLDPLPVSTAPDPQRKAAPAPQPADILRIAPAELARMAQVAMQGHGMALGVAEETSGLVAFAQAIGDPGVQTQLNDYEQGLISPAAVDRMHLIRLADTAQSCSVLDAQGAAGIACAAQAHDLAVVQALTSDKGVGLVAVREARHGGMMKELVLRA